MEIAIRLKNAFISGSMTITKVIYLFIVYDPTSVDGFFIINERCKTTAFLCHNPLFGYPQPVDIYLFAD